jgi:hypothetical protein
MNPCDRWRERLVEHAVGAPAVQGLADHLKNCSDCSVALAKMQRLAGKIDYGIRNLAAAEPGTDHARSILAAVEARRDKTRWWRPTGVAVAGAFAVATLLAVSLEVVWRIRAQREDSQKALLAAAEISNWKSPTSNLLHSPYESVLKAAPRLGEGFYRFDAGGVKPENSAPARRRGRNNDSE